MSEATPTSIAARVFRNLYNRKGFDWWFDGIDLELQVEVWDEMVATVEAAMADGEQPQHTVEMMDALRAELEDEDE